MLAHEMGHVAHRDAMRAIIHAGGISFLIERCSATLPGLARYDRVEVPAVEPLLAEQRVRADAFAIEVMTRAGGDVTALSGFLRRVARMPGERQLELLLTHPVTDDRIAAIERAKPGAPGRPLLDAAEWSALKAICTHG